MLSGNTGVVFKVLGPLECWHSDERIPLGGPLQERMLVALLLEANRLIPVSRLVETVWEGAAPATAGHQIRKMAGDLRRRIPDGGTLLQTAGVGYQVALAEEQLDLSLFTVHLGRARRAVAAGLRQNAVEQLRAALDLWRGPLLSGAGGLALEAATAELGEMRLGAIEDLIALRLELGAGSELVGELRRLVGEHPLRERLRGQLMLALYRAARQTEALEEYTRIRELLADEVGIDPSAELVRLHSEILRGDPALAGPAAAPLPAAAVRASESPPVRPTAPRRTEAPCSLPRSLPDFTGREQELADLIELGRPGAEMKVVSLEGMGGSGKTALAVCAAHALAEEYPDGQLCIDLAGFTPGQPAVDPSSALDVLLRTLGVPGDRVPDGLLNRTALWRVTTAQRRLLILLDNVSASDQVLPLLPASPGCLVLITSRVRLFDLDGSQTVQVDVLSLEDSSRLLVRVLGEARVAAEPEAALRLIEQCGRLPLALRICAGRLTDRPRWTLAGMADRLRLQTRRLHELRGGTRSVAACVGLSEQVMSEEARLAFRRLGSLPIHDFDVHGAAALLGTGVDEAMEQLEHLVDVNLLGQHAEDRYAFHDLVRIYACEAGGSWHEEANRQSAARFLDHCYLALVTAARLLYPGLALEAVDDLPETPHRPEFPDAAAALAWLDREYANLAAAVRLAMDIGLYWHAAVVPRYVSEYLQLNGYLEESLEISRIAVGAAEHLDDPKLLMAATRNVGVALWGLGRFQEGLERSEHALEIATGLGDQMAAATCLNRIGSFHNALGNYAEGLRFLEQALEIMRSCGMQRELAATQVAISSAMGYLGDYERSAQAARQAITVYQRLGYHSGEGLALVNLANAEVGRGRLQAALEHLTEAWLLAQLRGTGTRNALIAGRLAQVQLALGNLKEARRYMLLIRGALWNATDSALSVKLQNILGAVHERSEEYQEARRCLSDALAQAERIGFRIGAAEALQGLALVAEATGDTSQAEAQRSRARALFDAMGIRAGHVRTC